MQFKEYVDAINKVLAEPDTALVNIQGVTDSLKVDLEALDSVRAENAKLQDRIRDLQDTNMKLFLQAGGAKEEDHEEEEVNVDDMSFDEYMEYVKKENANEQND